MLDQQLQTDELLADCEIREVYKAGIHATQHVEEAFCKDQRFTLQ